MVRIISLLNPRLAQAFIDYMATQGICLESTSQGIEVTLWLSDDTVQDRVERELARFLSEPMHPRYQAASWHTGSTQHGVRYAHFSYLKNFTRQAGGFTIGISVATIFVYLMMVFFGDDAVMAVLAWPADSSQYFQIWRWVSHVLLHFSLWHILFNLMWWWYLGAQVERYLGSGKLVQITLVSAVMSGWAQSLVSGPYFGGLSGVVYALIGYVWWCGEHAAQKGFGIPRGLMVIAVLWLIVGHFSWFGMSIANAAHIGGLVIGLLMAFWNVHHKKIGS